MKTHVLIVSTHFMANHPRWNERTDFVEKIANGEKIHTLRGNYSWWLPRIQEVAAGKAKLSIRIWSGIPYRSKQIEMLSFTGPDIGIQKLDFNLLGWFVDGVDFSVTMSELAKNDGLHISDFIAWFKGEKIEDYAIIHFSDFRYKNSKTE